MQMRGFISSAIDPFQIDGVPLEHMKGTPLSGQQLQLTSTSAVCNAICRVGKSSPSLKWLQKKKKKYVQLDLDFPNGEKNLTWIKDSSCASSWTELAYGSTAAIKLKEERRWGSHFRFKLSRKNMVHEPKWWSAALITESST